ncbi:unnamed protein product, partial [Urochloa humidicola]
LDFLSLPPRPASSSEHGSGGGTGGEHGGVPAPAVRSCRRKRPTIPDLRGELRGSRATGGGGPSVASSGGRGEAADPRRGGRGGAWHTPPARSWAARAEASPASSAAPRAARGAEAAVR